MFTEEPASAGMQTVTTRRPPVATTQPAGATYGAPTANAWVSDFFKNYKSGVSVIFNYLQLLHIILFVLLQENLNVIIKS